MPDGGRPPAILYQPMSGSCEIVEIDAAFGGVLVLGLPRHRHAFTRRRRIGRDLRELGERRLGVDVHAELRLFAGLRRALAHPRLIEHDDRQAIAAVAGQVDFDRRFKVAVAARLRPCRTAVFGHVEIDGADAGDADSRQAVPHVETRAGRRA